MDQRQEKRATEIAAGIDVGSLSAEAVLLSADGVLAYTIIPTGVDSRRAAEKAIASALQSASLEFKDLDLIVATGYGRISVPFAHKQITEITCHGRGAFHLDPAVRTVIDIGGQAVSYTHLSALLEVLDPEQNHAFSDHYIELPFDLSQVMFITTANAPYNIPQPLLDRMETIHLPGYTEEDKVEIAKRHLIPKQISEHGLTMTNLALSEGAVRGIIRLSLIHILPGRPWM